MTQPYRLTIYQDRQIDRMLPFEARDTDQASAFADRQRFGQRAELWDTRGLIRTFPADPLSGQPARIPRSSL